MEKTELSLIALSTGLLTVLRPMLPGRIGYGYFVISLTLLFLVQNLIRDVWIIISTKKKPDQDRQSRCICIETVIGFVPIVLVGIPMLAGFYKTAEVPALAWPFAAPAVMLTAFLIKDYVLDLKTFRIRKEKDHIHIIFKWNPH